MAKDIRKPLLPLLQKYRQLTVDFGLRQYSVWLRVTTWTGARVGMGESTTTDRYLGKPKFRHISSEEVVAGSVMNEEMYEIGPFTPKHSTSVSTPDTFNVSPEELSPRQTGVPTEVYFLVKGPNFPAEGALFETKEFSFEKPFRYTVKIQAVGRSGA